MSENCPLCGHGLEEVKWYVRWFNPNGRRFEHCLTTELKASKRRFPHGMMEVDGKDQSALLIVNMVTGTIARNDFKRPLPEWLSCPYKRAIIAANGDLPPIYKNCKIEKLKIAEKKALDARAGKA